MRAVWIIGGSGLLGSALCRVLAAQGVRLFWPTARLPWHDDAGIATQLAVEVAAFATMAAQAESWQIYWAAGVGTMSSPAALLQPETLALGRTLALLGSSAALMSRPGAVALASSAGAIYSGTVCELITEDSPTGPTTDYANAKLAQEALILDFVQASQSVSVVNARISTLYGVGHAIGKKQGLLTHLAHAVIRNQSVQIFVPLDTIRDYIHAEDAALATVAAMQTAGCRNEVQTRIIASERPTTIAEIVAIFKKISRRPPIIVTASSRASSLYTRRVQFKSVVPCSLPVRPPRSLLIGINELLAAERSRFAAIGDRIF